MTEKTKAKKKNDSWMKPRHKVVSTLLRPVVHFLSYWRYHIKIEKFNKPDDRNYFIISNHQTGYDQFFIGAAFPEPVYYVASEDIFSMGRVSDFLRWSVAPIPIKKSMVDVNAVKTCMKVAREGGNVGLFPEGNRTFSGQTEHFEIGTVKLVRALKLPLAIFRIEGGYGVEPRWGNKRRKGPMRAYVKRIIEPEEYKKLSDDELFALLKTELYNDESPEGSASNEFLGVNQYQGVKLAEYVERAMYWCPECGLSQFVSVGDEFRCTHCGAGGRYMPDKSIAPLNEPGAKAFAYGSVKDWYKAQEAYINSIDMKFEEYGENPVYTDAADLSLVHPYVRKEKLAEDVIVKLFGNRVEIGDTTLMFDDVTAVSVLGRNKINIYYDHKIWQLKGDVRFNAVKYVNFFYRYQNISRGKTNEQFLGL